MKKILIITAIVVLVIAVVTLTGLYMIGDEIINEAIDMDIEALTAESTMQADGASAAQNQKEITEIEGTEDANKTSEKTSSAAATVSGDSGEKADTSTIQDKSSAKPIMTVEMMKKAKDEVSAQDKVTAASMVMSRLSSSDINKLKNMLPGGLTAEEKAEAKKIAYSRFTSEEILKIKRLYYKYMTTLSKDKN